MFSQKSFLIKNNIKIDKILIDNFNKCNDVYIKCKILHETNKNNQENIMLCDKWVDDCVKKNIATIIKNNKTT
jgi:hypothetical protein